MKPFKEVMAEAIDKKEATLQTIFKLWGQSADVEDIVKATGKTISQIKAILKKAGKRGWEEL